MTRTLCHQPDVVHLPHPPFVVCSMIQTALRSTHAFVVEKAQDLPSTSGPYYLLCLLPVMQNIRALPVKGVVRA